MNETERLAKDLFDQPIGRVSLRPPCHLVQDIDDTRQTRDGVYYTQKKPLTAATLADRPEKVPPGM